MTSIGVPREGLAKNAFSNGGFASIALLMAGEVVKLFFREHGALETRVSISEAIHCRRSKDVAVFLLTFDRRNKIVSTDVTCRCVNVTSCALSVAFFKFTVADVKPN